MIYPSGDKLEAIMDSRYALVVLAAKRAKQLREGAPKLIETASTNPLTVALEEIAAGKVKARMPDESELLAIEVRRREALAAFEEQPQEIEELAKEEKPSVQELLRVEGETPEAEAEAGEQPSVADLLKGEDEAPETEEEVEERPPVAELLKVDEEEPLAVEDIETAETGPSEE